MKILWIFFPASIFKMVNMICFGAVMKICYQPCGWSERHPLAALLIMQHHYNYNLIDVFNTGDLASTIITTAIYWHDSFAWQIRRHCYRKSIIWNWLAPKTNGFRLPVKNMNERIWTVQNDKSKLVSAILFSYGKKPDEIITNASAWRQCNSFTPP